GWLDRARRPRREEPYDHRSGGRRRVHAKAVPSRRGQRQALLVRSRGDARDARESRRIERRDSRGHEPGRSSTGAGCDEMVRRDHARSGTRPHVLDAERSGQRRAGSYLPGGYRRPERREARPPQRHRGAVRAFAGADRPRARPRASRPLLDRSRRPASRQHRESRAHRRGQSRRAGDRDDALDGGNRPRAGRSARPDVRDRLRRLRLLCQARWLRQEDVPLRKGQPHRRHVRRNRRKGEVIMAYDKPIHTIAIVGTGVIGASWAALYLARGFDVVATDPAPNAEANLRKYVDDAWKVLTSIGLPAGASRNRLAFTTDMKKALSAADFVQENGPERPDFKMKLFADMDDATPPDSIIASSSSGITPSVIQSKCKRPERILIGHPFNPPHIIPLVEVVGGTKTSPEAIKQAMAFYASIGKKPIYLRKELPGHVANRLQAALYREMVNLIEQEVLSVEEADTAVSYGPGLRWGVMGQSLQWHLGGGAGGINHFMEHLMDPLAAMMKTLGDPQVTPELKQTIVEGVMREAAGRSVDELARDENEVIIGLLRLRANGASASSAKRETA